MALPVAAIVCIVLACWVIIVLVLLAVYQVCKTRGSCSCDCNPCGQEGGGNCCDCCVALSDSCNCCNPSVGGCLDSICPGKKKVSCVDILLCQCCANPGEEPCCLKICPCCNSDCRGCDSECCMCCFDCDAVTCCCLEIRLVAKSDSKTNSSNAMKYTTTTTTTHSNALISSNIVKEKKKKTTIILDRSGSDVTRQQEMTSSPRTPTSARSVSQLELISYSGSNNQMNPRSSKPKVKLKASAKSVSLKQAVKDSSKTTAKSRSLPSLPSLPSHAQTSMHGSKNKHISTKSAAKHNDKIASELVEIAVKQNVPLHTYMSPRHMSAGKYDSDAYLMLGSSPDGSSYLSQQDVPMDAMNINFSASDMQIDANEALTHGSIIDGSGTHRSLGAGSSFNGQFVTGRSMESLVPSGQSVTFTSNPRRPLPVPTSR